MHRLTVLFCAGFLSIASLSSGQNFQTVYSHRELMYGHLGFKIDSVRVAGADTIMHCVRQPRGSAMDCAEAFGTSWLGDSIRVMPDGTSLFYLPGLSPLVIHSRADSGTSWTFGQWDDGSRITAVMGSTEWQPVMGIMDSIKTITVHAVDSLGNAVSWMYDGTEIKISKSFGICSTYSFYDMMFPDSYDHYDDQMLVLSGCSNPETGTQNLTWRRIFDFAVGDVFLVKTTAFRHDVTHKWMRDLTLTNVLEKSVVASGDTVIYLMEQCRHIIHDTDGIQDIQSIHDTIMLKICLTNPLFDKLPFACYQTGYEAKYTYMGEMYGRDLKSESTEWYVHSIDSCWGKVLMDFSCTWVLWNYYIDGCGGPYYSFSGCFVGGYSWGSSCELLYYRKGLVEWGTPSSCESIVNGIYSEPLGVIDAKVYPNPMSAEGHVEIVLPAGHTGRFVLRDLSGAVVMDVPVKSGITTISRNGIPSGLYHYQVLDAGAVRASGKWVLQ